MKIERIVTKNFRQYKDVEVDFAKRDSDHIVVIGTNGAGKTTMLNVLTWCFYGKELHFSRDSVGRPICNTQILDELETGDTASVEVEVWLEDDGVKKLFKRRQVWESRDKCRPSEFNVLQQTKSGWTPLPHPTTEVLKTLPERIQEYFFFNGEQLETYFGSKRRDNIRDAVFQVSQLQVVENTMRHLGNYENKLRDSIPATADTGTLDIERKDLENEVHALDEELSDLRQQKIDVDNEFKEIEIAIGDFAGAAEKQKRREEKEEELKREQDRLANLKEERFFIAVNNALSVITYPATLQLLQLKEEKIEKRQIPPLIDKSLVEKCLKDSTCICGRKLENDSRERKEFIDLLDSIGGLSDSGIELVEIGTKLRNSKSKATVYKRAASNIRGQIFNSEELIEELNREINDIGKELRNIDVSGVSRMEATREDLKGEGERLHGNIVLKEKNLKECKDKLSLINDKLDRALEKEGRNKVKLAKLALCKKSQEELTRIEKEIMKEIKDQVEEKTSQLFFEIIWKKKTYKDVSIDDDFNISVIDNHGFESIDSLAAGETLALALAFMAALNSVSGFVAPIIIDSPLGRLGSEIRENLSNAVTEALIEKQVIVFVLDTEYTNQVRMAFSRNWRDIRELELEFNETDSSVEVKTYAS